MAANFLADTLRDSESRRLKSRRECGLKSTRLLSLRLADHRADIGECWPKSLKVSDWEAKINVQD